MPVGEWIEWKGGKQPVEDDVIVEVEYRAPAEVAKGMRIDFPCVAGRLDWRHDTMDDDIVAYRKWEPEYE